MGDCCGKNDKVRNYTTNNNFELLPQEEQLNKYGEPLKYDTEFKGPLSKRSCTDVLCLIIFVVFLILWAYIAFFAIRNGDLEKLVVPIDSKGYRCGVDSPVLNKPYLFFFNLEKCISPLVPITGCPTPQVCVEKCPDEMFIYENFQGTLVELKEKLICQTEADINSILTKEDAKVAVQQNRCAAWYIPSVPVSRRCFPKNGVDIAALVSALHILPADFNQALAQVKLLANINGLGQLIVEDLMESWPTIAIGLILAMILSLIFIAIMRWIAKPIVWLSIIGVLSLLAYGTYCCVTMYIYYRDNPVHTGISPNLVAYLRSWGTDKTTWLVLSIIISVLFIVLLLVVIFLRDRIQIAIALIKEGSKAVSSIISTVFFPIIPWLFQVASIVLAITIGLYLASVGDSSFKVAGSIPNNCICTGPAATYADGQNCNPKTFDEYCQLPVQMASELQRLLKTNHAPCTEAGCYFEKISNPNIIGYMQAYNVIAFLWVVFFISAYGEMVLAAAFATWYWTFHKSDVPFFTLTKSVARTTRYHLGTLAFGSLIITICRIIRLILEWIDTKLKKFDNACTRAIMCCMRCFFWCLEKFLRFINKNAYIMCAIHGKNFCTSARDAFNLMMRNYLRVIAVDKVTEFLFFLSKVLLTLGLGTATYFYIGTYTGNQEEHFRITPTVIVMIGTYLITSVFFGVYSMAVDTLFLCFLEDSERNDGSAEKPYFMSKQLMKILGKRNKVPRNEYS